MYEYFKRLISYHELTFALFPAIRPPPADEAVKQPAGPYAAARHVERPSNLRSEIKQIAQLQISAANIVSYLDQVQD